MIDEIVKWLLSIAILGLIVVSSMLILYLFVNWPHYSLIGCVVIGLIASFRWEFFD